jgi:hypothetical protein
MGRDWFFEVLTNYSFNSSGWRDSCFTVKMWRSPDVLLWGHGWTPRDKLYGIVDQLIDPSLGLHEPIGIPKLSTFDLQLCMILTISNSFFVIGLYKFLQTSRIVKLFHIKKKHAIIKTWHLKNQKENIKRFFSILWRLICMCIIFTDWLALITWLKNLTFGNKCMCRKLHMCNDVPITMGAKKTIHKCKKKSPSFYSQGEACFKIVQRKNCFQ